MDKTAGLKAHEDLHTAWSLRVVWGCQRGGGHHNLADVGVQPLLPVPPDKAYLPHTHRALFTAQPGLSSERKAKPLRALTFLLPCDTLQRNTANCLHLLTHVIKVEKKTLTEAIKYIEWQLLYMDGVRVKMIKTTAGKGINSHMAARFVS